jgi:hypothetical protein
MRVAIIGSRNAVLTNLENHLPKECTEIISGGAKGVDTYAGAYAIAHKIPLTVFLPEYAKYGRGAPIVRNMKIVEYADFVLAFWDGTSRGTKSVLDFCKKQSKAYKIIYI